MQVWYQIKLAFKLISDCDTSLRPRTIFLGNAIGAEFQMMSNVRIFSFISVISIRVIHGVGINIFA